MSYLIKSESHKLEVVFTYAWSHALHLNELHTVSALLCDFLGEVLHNSESSLLMVVILILDISWLGQLHSLVEGLLLFLLGEVLHDRQHSLLVIIMVNNFNIVWLDVHEVDARNILNWLFREVLNDCKGCLMLIVLCIFWLVVSVVLSVRLNVESLCVSLSLIHHKSGFFT